MTAHIINKHIKQSHLIQGIILEKKKILIRESKDSVKSHIQLIKGKDIN